MSEFKENIVFWEDKMLAVGPIFDWMQVLRLRNLMFVCTLLILNGEFYCFVFVAQFKISYNIVTKQTDFPLETRNDCFEIFSTNMM